MGSLIRTQRRSGTERDLKAVFPREIWNQVHLQIIYFGRAHCPALRHDLATCPICSWAATKKRIAEESLKMTSSPPKEESRQQTAANEERDVEESDYVEENCRTEKTRVASVEEEFVRATRHITELITGSS